MTLQSLDFCFENGALAVFGGSADRQESLLDTVLHLAGLTGIVNRDPDPDSILATESEGDNSTDFPTDPVRHPSHLTLSVRAFGATENTLQRLVASEGLTFWGEAIALILEFCALNPDWPDLHRLEDAPRGLARMGGAIRFPGAPVSRGIQTPLSPRSFAWVQSVAQAHGIGVEKAASLILYRNAAAAVATIQAARAAE